LDFQILPVAKASIFQKCKHAKVNNAVLIIQILWVEGKNTLGYGIISGQHFSRKLFVRKYKKAFWVMSVLLRVS
jgi:hypothetical protein